MKQPAVNFDFSCRTNWLLHPIFSTKCTPSSRPSPRFPVEFFHEKPSWENLFQLSWQRHKVGYRSFKESELLRKLPQQKMMRQTDASNFFWKKRMVGLLSHEIVFFIFLLVSWRYVQSVVNQLFVFLGNIWCWKGVKSIKQIMVFKKLSYYIFSSAKSRVMAEFSIILRCKIRCPSALVPQIF